MASMNLDDTSIVPHLGPVYESDIEAELEVDQLDSDSDNDAVDSTKTNNASKNGTGRVPGHSLLSAVRLDNMIQADGVTGSLALSREGLFLLSVATEGFIKRLIQAGHREASAHRRHMINYNDMAATTQQYQEFMFLSDTIPACITLAEALVLRQRKEREMLEDNPAMAPSFRMSSSAPMPDAESTMPDLLKSTKRSRSTNGKEKINGSASTVTRPASRRPAAAGHQVQNADAEFLSVDKEWDDPASLGGGESSDHRRSIRNGFSSASTPSSIPPPLLNGHSSGISRSLTPPLTQNGSEHGAIPLQPQYPDSHSHSLTPSFPAHNDPAWTGQFTGPASGFLHGTVASFGRVNQNPGRTIYSQSTSQHPD